MKHPGRPSRVARFLLWLRPLGDRRADVEADFDELFALRSAESGIRYARRRYLVDVLSLWRRAPQARQTVAAVRQTHPSRWWSGAGADVRYALRVFRRQAGAVLTAIFGLAVAIGLVTAVFSITNAFNFRPLGVARPDAVVRIHRTVGTMRAPVDWTLRDYEQVRTAAQLTALEASFAGAVLFSDMPELVRSSDAVPVRFVTPTLVETFGGHATLGRLFTPADNAPRAVPVALVHHVFWRTALGGDPTVVGRALQMNGAPVIVIGVLDRAFTGPFEATMAPAILLPLSAAPVLRSANSPNGPIVSVVGSLRDRATREQAEAELTAIATALDWTRDASSPKGAAGVSVRAGGNQFTSDDLLMVTIFMSIVGLVLLLAATNVASVLLASATSRQQEIAARLALGASRGRVMRQLLTESLLLAVAAGAGGLLMSAWLTPLSSKLFAMPPTIDLVIDWRVCLFTSLASAFAGVAAGLTPARVGAGGDVLSPLKGGTHQAGTGRRSARLRTVFLGIQAAATVLLLVLTMLFGRALLEVSRARLGFDPDKLVTVSASASGRSKAIVPSAEFWEIALARLRAFPEIASVALVEDLPFGNGFHPVATTLDGRRYRLVRNDCSADYFETVGERLIAGRTFTHDEVRLRAPVAVISAGLARDFWPGGDALQSTLGRVDVAFTGVRVVGIVGEPAPVNFPPRYAGAAVVYRPLGDIEVARAVIRIADGVEPPLPAIRDALSVIDNSRRLYLETARDGLERGLKAPRTLALVMGILGGVALTLAVIGVFGVTAFVVGQRRREISIRMALGATRRDVVRSVIAQGMRPIVIGLVAGVILALAGAQVVAFALFAGVSPRDPLAFAAAVAVLLAAAGAGLWIPAQQAARLDPATVLKES